MSAVSVVVGAAWCIAAGAIVLGVTSLVAFRQPLVSLPTMLDLFTAAGMLRLSVDASWAAIAGVAVLIALRRLITHTLTADLTAGRRARRTSA